jgi:hypothetical protein
MLFVARAASREGAYAAKNPVEVTVVRAILRSGA